jgi:hypothetical protein
MTSATIDRTPKLCTHQKKHVHGERATFKVCGCRCAPCSQANNAYQKAWERARLYGRPTTSWVDAGPVRAHVEQLQAAGLGWRTVSERAGVAQSVVSALLYGRVRETGRDAPSKRLNPTAAAKLLALPIPTPLELAGAAVVDGTGTRRRLQALARVGWSVNRLVDGTEIDPQPLRSALHGGQVMARTARAVAALYEAHWDRRPVPDAHEWRDGNGIARTIKAAIAASWPPPIAWDDDSIDDPAAVPVDVEPVDQVEDDVDEFAVELVLDGQPMHLDGRELEVAAMALSDRGLNYGDIAARCRSDETTVRRVLNTARQRIARETARQGVA